MSIEGSTISVLVTTYCRFENLDRILAAWLRQPVDEVWLIDGSGRFQSSMKDQRFTAFSMPRDFGTGMDYALAPLTQGDYIILADDDVLPEPGFVEDLFRGYFETGGAIVGIIGRTFYGPRYKGDTEFFAANKTERPVRVGFVGVVCFAARQYFGFDVRGLPRNADDLWWQMREYPRIAKYVIPTKAYLNLPECEDDTAMFHDRALREQRQEFYEKWYRCNYEPTGRTY